MTVAVASIYEAYAPIYDAIGQGRFSVRMAAWSLSWLAGRGVHPRRVLDLACGTGAAALAFAAAGRAVVGLDRSAPMLEIARGRARDAGADVTFVQGDIRGLRELISHNDGITSRKSQVASRKSRIIAETCDLRPATCDLVTCFYDSLNYLIEDGDLERVFAGVARVLSPGGYLIFDINTAAEFATWDERDVVTHDGRDILVYNRLNYDPAARLATGRIVWFVREIERWWRGEETHVERAWDDAEVEAALAEARLAPVARLDTLGNTAGADAPRVVYVARHLNRE